VPCHQHAHEDILPGPRGRSDARRPDRRTLPSDVGCITKQSSPPKARTPPGGAISVPRAGTGKWLFHRASMSDSLPQQLRRRATPACRDALLSRSCAWSSYVAPTSRSITAPWEWAPTPPPVVLDASCASRRASTASNAASPRARGVQLLGRCAIRGRAGARSQVRVRLTMAGSRRSLRPSRTAGARGTGLRGRLVPPTA